MAAGYLELRLPLRFQKFNSTLTKDPETKIFLLHGLACGRRKTFKNYWVERLLVHLECIMRD